MNLHTQRLKLTELTEKDLEAVHQLHCDPMVERYNTIGIPSHINITAEILRPVFENRQCSPRSVYGWGIRLIDSDLFIGEAGMTVMNNRYQKAEIHYHIRPDHWGNGYATEVARELIRFAFEDLKLHRVEAGAATENTASHRVMEKAGMIKEGKRRAILPIRGTWHDNYTYAILETDPRG